MTYEDIIEKIRREKDEYFKNSPYSPLTETQKLNFHGLSYFPVDPKYRFELKLNEFQNKAKIKIITSKGTEQEYIRYGYFEFEIDGEKCTLSVFKQPNSTYLFLPFKDQTSGNETYGAGRYLEIEKIKKNKYLLDFNLAYNPYCAYNDNWVCPLVPFENILRVPIYAGEKKLEI